jgi:TorA maturation chaperone TorD
MFEESGETFGALAMIYSVISRLFAAPPDESMLGGLQTIDSEENVLLSPEDADWTEGLQLIAGYCRGDQPKQRIVEATGDHSQLFVGPGHLLAPPWASVYLDSGMMYGPSTLQVADTYKGFGLTVPNPGTEPDDHIAFELGFVAALNQKLQTAIEAGDEATATETTGALHRFVGDHMAAWLVPFLSRIEEHAETDFYRGLAKITRALTVLEQRFAGQLSVELCQA